MGVTINATFLINLDSVHFLDLKADDLGSWKPNGTKSTYFRVESTGAITCVSTKPKSDQSAIYSLTRRYYVHSTYHLFHRTIVDIKDGIGRRHNISMVRYIFNGPEVDIKIRPHGNSKQDRHFFRTASSTKDRIKKIVSDHKPKEAVDILTKGQGGELDAPGVASLPRDQRQIKYARQQKHAKDPNPLYSIMLECKLAQGSSQLFVQDVKGAPQPMCVLSSEWQLDDMVRFLTSNHRFGILAVDTTYNLGNFFVTPMTYPHVMLQDVKTSKPPMMLGPVLIHQRVDFTAFNYFASTLVGCRRKLRQLMAFGSDGDKAVVEAFTHNFPYAIQLRCFIHFRRNVQEKLKGMGFPSSVANEFLADIFGKQVGNTFQAGLADSCSVDDFDQRFDSLIPVWNARESSCTASSESSFYSYFSQYQSDVVRYHLRKDIREASGLGSPPEFTTNCSESINAAIKRKVNHKESEWPEFNEHLKAFVQSQKEEITRALSGRGQYRLNPEFSHYGVSTQEWIKMRPDQRKQVLDNFQKATLPVYAKKCQGDSQESVSSDGLSLSISAENSDVTTIPLVTLNGIWAIAEKILKSDNGITPAPGENKKCKMVMSYSQANPHYVNVKSDGQYTCDSACLQWESSQICSHTIAAAECNGELASFLQWYTKCAENPNISTIAMSGLPSGRGKKGGRPKRQRTKKNTLSADNVTLRPGLQSAERDILHTGQVVSMGSHGTVNSGAVVNMTSPSTSQLAVPSNIQQSSSHDRDSQLNISLFQLNGPPPLLPIVTPAPHSVNLNPFFVKPLSGNIRVCQGCRGSLRLSDSSIPVAPFDIVVARIEKRSYCDATGALKTPVRPSAAHYHIRLACIRAVEPTFVSSNLTIPADVRQLLTAQHYQHLSLEFGLN